MYAQCKAYLMSCLKAAGIKSAIHTTRKTLEKSQESHVGAVLFENEEYLRNGSKIIGTGQGGAAAKQMKVFDRTISFSVVIGEYTDDGAETILTQFLSNLPAGIEIDGYYTRIEAGQADWVDSEDSILKSKVAVQVQVSFFGGVYRKPTTAKLQAIEVSSVERT